MHITTGWWRALGEVVFVGSVLVVSTRLHAAAGTDIAAAAANAPALQSVERRLGLDVELAPNRWLSRHPVLIATAVAFYRLYYLVLVGVLAWIVLRYRERYAHLRRTFVAMIAVALVVFWTVPMSPPRFALTGVVDIIAEHDIVAGQPSRDMGSGANHFSAMPSLHVGWSAWAAYAVWSALRTTHPRAALLAWLFPLVMVAHVLGTGNHYLLDCAGSGVLAASIALALGWARPRRFRSS